jgi:hypothetical protein
LPGCPTAAKIVSLTLANLDRGPDRSCPMAGEITIDARATDNGGARLAWDAQEFDATTCAAVGPKQEGEVSVSGPCCNRTLDVYFPKGDVTARLDVRTDWQP